MIGTWMVYAVTVAFVLGVAGAAGERCLRALGRPARWSVAGGLVASAVLPLFALLVPGVQRPHPAWSGEVLETALDRVLPGVVGAGAGAGIPGMIGRHLDAAILILWGVTSATALLLGNMAQLRLIRAALRCPEERIEGIEVKRTRALGPAVVGWIRGLIVFPEWLRTLDEGTCRLAVLHEEEHRRARDPLLLFGAWVLVALEPWNPGLWWQIARLKRAVETDCDRRVLAGGADPRSYATLLIKLSMAGHPSSPILAAFGTSGSRVGRRIRTWADGLSGPRPVRAVTWAGLAVAALALLLLVPAPGFGRSPVPTSFTAGPVALAPPVDSLLRQEVQHLHAPVRVKIPQLPDYLAPFAVDYPDGSMLRVERADTWAGYLVTCIHPGSAGAPDEARREAMKLEWVNGKPVITRIEA